MPIGMQVVGPYGGDFRTIRLAAHAQRCAGLSGAADWRDREPTSTDALVLQRGQLLRFAREFLAHARQFCVDAPLLFGKTFGRALTTPHGRRASASDRTARRARYQFRLDLVETVFSLADRLLEFVHFATRADTVRARM
jgi:hypothetical protein